MGVDNVFAIDIFQNLIAQIENVCGFSYDPKDLALAPAFHVIADHIRSLSFAIADGAQPSNIERGYVLRKDPKTSCPLWKDARNARSVPS